MAWQPVYVALVHAQSIKERGSKSTNYRLAARYQFDWAGAQVQGQRVAISERSDNIGNFQEQLGLRLQHALDNGRSVQACVNPSDAKFIAD